ncbi:hypothetical protein MKX03_018026 [Papaver bracteatum]|nr:hypothetical protein MKX03_018026 [Papaver bracteatum]
MLQQKRVGASTLGKTAAIKKTNSSLLQPKNKSNVAEEKFGTSTLSKTAAINKTNSSSLQLKNNSNDAEEKGGTSTLSKTAVKKEANKLQGFQGQQEAAAAAMEADPPSEKNGEVAIQDLQSKHVNGRTLTEIRFVNETLKDKTVLIRGKIQISRSFGKNSGFLVLKEKASSIQCVLSVEDNLTPQMVKFATSLSKEFNVEIEGIVSVPDYPIKRATQNVELQVIKIYYFSEDDNKKAQQDGKQIPHINQGRCLNFRVLDVCTPANQQMFRIQCQQLHKQMAPPVCLAQSPQLHKQMAICWGFGSVFEIGSVFRVEKSHKLRYLCEFIGLDLEMEIQGHYSEVMDIVDGLFVAMFDSLNEKCKKELEAIGNQYPFEPLKYIRKTPRLTFEEGVQMLKEAGVKANPLRDLKKKLKRKLGKLVLEKYGTEFYILHRYPTAIRPFYTMPCYDNPTYSQRVHYPELLNTRAESCGINLKYGTPPLGGFGVDMERVVMLFCGLNNIHETALCSLNPQRITP